MGTGYTRQDTANNIDPDKVARAEDIDAELNAVQAAFDSSTGHTHDGTSAEGAPIEVTGPAQEYLFDGTAIFPKTDDTYDLGKVAAEFRNLYIDGTAFLDAVDIDGGVIDGVSIGSNSAGAGAFTTLSASGIVTLDLSTLVSAGDLPVASGGTGASTQAGARANLGVAIGTDVQAASTHLTAIADAAKTDGNFIVANGTTYVVESGATARTSLGLGSMATQNAGTVNISGGTIAGITDLAVADGGTGASTQAGARTNLGVAIGSDVQGWYSVLDTIGTNGGVDTTELIDDSVTYAKIDNSILTGVDLQLVSGTAGTSGNLARWNADGDLVGSVYSVIDDDTMASASSTTIATSESTKAYVDNNSGSGWETVSTPYNDGGTVTSIETPDFEDGYEYRMLIEGLQHDTATDATFLEIFGETAGAYTTPIQIIGGASLNAFRYGIINMETVRSTKDTHMLVVHSSRASGGSGDGVFIGTNNSFFILNRYATAQKITKVRLSATGGANLLSGTVIVQRRRI